MPFQLALLLALPSVAVAFSASSAMGVARHSPRPASSPLRMLSVGDTAPDFSLADQSGVPVTLSKLRGKPVVVFFYPNDGSPGCTKEALAFQDAMVNEDFGSAKVIGISQGSIEKKQEFIEKNALTQLTLLADEGNVVRKEWEVPTELLGLFPGRVTYVLDKNGVVVDIYQDLGGSEKHPGKALDALASIPAEKPTNIFAGLFK